MIARGFFLFVGVIVFFIHNDQAERVNRSKHRRARADDNFSAALPDLVPFIVAFPGRKMAVQHGDQRRQRA